MVDKARNLCLYQAKKDEFGESSKFVNFVKDSGKKARVEIDEEAIAEASWRISRKTFIYRNH